MTSIPDQALIGSFMEVTGADTVVAMQFLQGANNQLETAVGHFFDNPNRYAQQYQSYDEGAFSQGHYGNTAFQIHSHEPMGAGDTHSTVVTRPNSPANSENLQVSPQESGIIGSSYGTNFGPATKDSYDLQKWAMTVPDATAAEIIPDVDPWDRIRGNDPVFMKPLTDSDPLPALMTILGQIPLAQEVLLSAGGLINDYGGDPTWWSGTPIKLTEMVAESSQPAPDDARDLITETQRLMAFMIGSDRLYGSVEPLGSLRALKEAAASEQTQVKNGVDKFVLAWSNAVNSRSDGPESAKLFRTLAFSEDVPELTFFQCEVPLEYTVDNAPISIYDAVDHYIWGGEVTEAADNCLVETAPILVMRIVQNDTSVPGLKMQVPETWYVDRYMAENKIAARQMRENIGACNEEVYNLDLHIKDIGEFQQLATGTWDLSMNLFENAIEYLRSSPPRAAEDHDDDSDMDMESVYADSHAAELADRLHSVYGKLKLKMQRLQEEKKAAMAKLEKLSNLLKYPSAENPEQDQPKHRYTLRGVSTNSTNYRTVYVNCPSEFEYLHWYKIEYDTTPAVYRRRLAIEEVLGDASELSKEVLLVYASDDAIEDRETALPPTLQAFIDRDNQAFKDEQAVHEAQFQTGGYTGHSAFEDDSPIDEDPPPYDGAFVGDEVWQADDPIRGVGEHSGATNDTSNGASSVQNWTAEERAEHVEQWGGPEDQDRHLW